MIQRPNRAVNTDAPRAPLRPRGGRLPRFARRHMVASLTEYPRTLLAVLLCGTVATTYAQEAHRPQVKVGDEWRFAVYYTVPSAAPNRVWVVTRILAETIEMRENGEPLLLTADLNVLDSPRLSESNPKLLSFPLRVGKRWQFESSWKSKAKGSSGTISTDVEVQALERIVVPAGEFVAYRLLARGRLDGMSRSSTFIAGEVTTTYWYAQAARAIVKLVQQHPYQGPMTIQLVSIQSAP